MSTESKAILAKESIPKPMPNNEAAGAEEKRDESRYTTGKIITPQKREVCGTTTFPRRNNERAKRNTAIIVPIVINIPFVAGTEKAADGTSTKGRRNTNKTRAPAANESSEAGARNLRLSVDELVMIVSTI
jgi:hypothetical protein